MNFLLLTLSATLALGLGEFAVRILRPQQLRHLGALYRPADTIGFERRPDLHTRANLGDRWVDVITDHQGFRVGRAGRVEADTRVLLLGDSFVEALGVTYEESFAGLLQARLPARLGRPVAVRNGGVSGYSPSHYLLAAERALRREPFALVVVAI